MSLRTPRIYTPFSPQVGGELDLDTEASHHLLQVLRFRSGSALTLFNGDGRNYAGVLTQCTRKSARVAITSQSELEQPAALQINLGLGLSKGERMDFAVQKSVELGVTRITPLITEHSVVRLSAERRENRQEHWKRVAIAACEQSGRCRLPVIEDILPLQQWLIESQQNCGLGILLDYRSNSTLNQLDCSASAVNLLIGPEGGFSNDERAMAQTNGFVGVHLGPRVLRTETAPLAAISAMQMLWGDFR